ncbi:MAG TPA: methylenetetrahydrofolate--tRNA-(uracil(54)-C(5))-methyltransferase (FADH(2)-oxidizing) TrmFO [Candidatus Obscuribacterales bacterium]
MAHNKVIVIGGGLAGSEAAWQLASEGIEVDLYEMRPVRKSPAHHTDRLAELVCSNSMGGFASGNASALLKEEMKTLGAKLLQIAWQCHVPAGGALAVDREAFAQTVTDEIYKHPKITVHRQEFPHLPDDQIAVVATGPLTSESLAASISAITGQSALHFFDAASPILTKDSINHDIVFAASRYDKGEGVYLNCPMDKEQYLAFWEAITAAERVELKDFEKDTPYFESCLPVEVIASRGKDTLRFGPMKPVGLTDPRANRRPWAVVQLRQDNAAANLYNIVGFQTNLKWGEQKRVFRMIPGLENAEFVRLGVMHRNTYLNSPLVLERTLQLKARPNVFFGGQLTGVEGYTESMATGLIAAKNAARLFRGEEPLVLPDDTMIGALIRYITHPEQKNLQPINANWGIIAMSPEVAALDKEQRRLKSAEGSLASIKRWSAGFQPASV